MGKQFILKLNHVLLFNIVFLIVIIFTLFLRITLFKPISKYSGDEQVIVGKVVDIKESKYNTKLIVKAKEKVLVTTKDNKYQLGDIVTATGKLEKPVKSITFDYPNYLKSKKIFYIFKSDIIIIKYKNNNVFYESKNKIINYINTLDNKDYLKAFIIGDNSEMDEYTKSTINSLGISHLFALSGMHVSFISLIIFKILNRVFANKITMIIWTLILIYYLFLTSFTPSITRAVICSIFIKWTSLKPIKILIILAIILLIDNPYYIYNLGFLFSFSISYFLLLFKKSLSSKKSYFSKLLYTSLFAFLVSIPILSYNFYEINLLTPIINLIFIPFVTIILFPITILSFIVPESEIILTLLINMFELLISMLDIFIININLPKLPIYLYFIYYLIIFLILIDKKYVYLFIIVFLLHAHVYKYTINATLTMIDVNQGDSTLIDLGHGNGALLVDTGGVINSDDLFLAKSRIIPYMKSIGVTKLDYLILTHGDSDHIKEALYLVDNFPIKKVLLNRGSNNTLERKIINKLKINKIKYEFVSDHVFTVNNNKFYILNRVNKEDENKDSLILYTKTNKRNILLMGDASVKEEKYIINKYDIPKLDILKIGHHGSRTSSDPLFLDIMAPRISLISAGKNNLYNHPNKEVIDNLKSRNINIYSTKELGTVIINLKEMTIN